MTALTANSVYEDTLHLLGGLAPLVLDPSISEVMVNPNGTVFIERGGVKSALDVIVNLPNLMAAGSRIARQNQDELSAAKPIFNGRLGDGTSRVCIVIPPASPDGPLWSIRKFPQTKLSSDDLIRMGTMTGETREYLQRAVSDRETILISGGPGTGKTTLLQILAQGIDASDRIVLIEKPNEIQVSHKNLVRLEANDDTKVTMKLLVQTVLRLLPNRVIFGEVSGDEAADLLEVLNTGHPGSFTTIHANSALLSLSRLTNLAFRGGAGYIPTRRLIGDVVRHVVHLRLMSSGQRVVSEVIRVKGYSPKDDEYAVERFI
jgi:pilus assembly protein CpaF